MIGRDLSEEFPVFAVVLQPTEATSRQGEKLEEIKELLHKFDDVFSEKLPKGLPPKRSQYVRIELKDGAQPQKKGL